MKGTINGKDFEATEFFYDGCHKIYLADSDESYRQMYAAGWDERDLFPIEDLPSVWISTCPLRFISSGDLNTRYVEQCEPADFIGWDMDGDMVLELLHMNLEQLQANGAF